MLEGGQLGMPRERIGGPVTAFDSRRGINGLRAASRAASGWSGGGGVRTCLCSMRSVSGGRELVCHWMRRTLATLHL